MSLECGYCKAMKARIEELGGQLKTANEVLARLKNNMWTTDSPEAVAEMLPHFIQWIEDAQDEIGRVHKSEKESDG